MTTYVFSTIDPQRRSISLTEDCFRFHILLEHPDMTDVDEIEQTVNRPEFIARDAVDPARLELIGEGHLVG
jgi:hypothetical protein